MSVETGSEDLSVNPEKVFEAAWIAGAGVPLDPDAIAEAYWQLRLQHYGAWTQEVHLLLLNDQEIL